VYKNNTQKFYDCNSGFWIVIMQQYYNRVYGYGVSTILQLYRGRHFNWWR